MTKKKITTIKFNQYNGTFKSFFLQRKIGVGNFFFNYFIKRLELPKKSINTFLPNKFRNKIYKYLAATQPDNSYIMNRYKVIIFFCDIIQSFKGWRHLKGLPTNGQRTWSNGWTAYRSNIILRDNKLKTAKNFYGRGYKADVKVSFMAEHINWLWKKQWPWEWAYSRQIVYRVFRKNPYKFQIDLFSMASGLLGSLKPNNPKQGKKKKKLLTGYVGFDKNFTKLYARYLINMSKKRKRKNKLR